MKTIALIADSHFDSSPNGRLDECIRLHDWIADDMEARKVDGIGHAGDVFERASTSAERNAVAAWVTRCANIAPMLLVAGNHDAIGADGRSELEIFNRLRAKHPITVEPGVGVHTLAGVNVAAVAWPRRSTFAASMPRASLAEQSAGINAELARVFHGLGKELERRGGPRLVVSHAMVGGSRTSSGQPLIGTEIEVGLADLALTRAPLIVLGHVHLSQAFRHGESEIAYVGSPRRTNYGEQEAKGYMLVHYDGDRLVGWERVETPATPMVDIEATWNGGVNAFEGHAPELTVAAVTGAEVRFRYTVPVDQRDAAARAAQAIRTTMLAVQGAVAVKVEETVIAETRARSVEIARAPTLEQKLPLFWRHKGIEIPPERETRLLGKVGELRRRVRKEAVAS